MKTRLLHSIMAMSALTIAVLACSVATPGGSDAPPNIPTAISGGSDPGNTNNNGDAPPAPPSNGDRPLVQDDFRGRDSNWGVGTDADSSVEYVDDALKFELYTTNYFVWSTPGDTEYKNVHIEVTVANSSADKNAAFGIMCNQQFMDDEFYYVYITPNGDYGIVKSMFVEDDIDLATGASDLIPQNASSYTLGMDCGNGTVTLYVNGQTVDTATDTAADALYSSGGVALFAWSDEVANGVTISFDDFVITELK
ncbi:MAG: hypothetical protein HFACDABA_00544 [Anaerolineales bacterium]|nr:hypothetical protein [Anaerolineales bacterium]